MPVVHGLFDDALSSFAHEAFAYPDRPGPLAAVQDIIRESSEHVSKSCVKRLSREAGQLGTPGERVRMALNAHVITL